MFFFFKQKTECEMRISYWSAVVCSSDLEVAALYLIAPINEQDVHGAENPRITFRWDADVDLLGSDEFETQLFVSALRPGQGLWPDDTWPDRNPLFEDDPDTDDLDDFNPNRIFTSKRLQPGANFHEIGRASCRERVCQSV